MSPVSLIIIVGISSFIHAAWNYMAKTIAAGSTIFVWWIAFLVTILYAPLVIVYTTYYKISLSNLQLYFLAGTAIIHLFYFLILQRGYQKSDLSVVYPIARGTGPVLATLGAVYFLHESISQAGIVGLFFVLIGIGLISELPIFNLFYTNDKNNIRLTDKNKLKTLELGILYGLSTGIFIACYTLLDAFAVRQLKIPILLVEYISHPFRVLMLLPFVARQPRHTLQLWQEYPRKLLLIALICPLPFMLVLYALQYAPVGYVAPAREFSIVVGVFLGAKLLAEKNMTQRLIGATCIVFGIIILSWAKL